MDPEIWKWLLGLGGIVLSGGVGKLIYDLRSGHVIKEESAIASWQAIAQSRLEEIERMNRRLAWYESNYAALWYAYSVGPPPGPERFPFAPSADLHPPSSNEEPKK